MSYAIVSDIHANWQAWSAVRDDIRQRTAGTMVCLGDIVGYGPSPTRVFSDVLAHCDNFVLGNHDAAAAGKLDPSVFNENARRSTAWTAAQFDRSSLKRLGEAPLVLEDEDVLFVHAETPAPDEFGYVETVEDARACFEATDKRFIFIGHTHRPTVFALAPDGTVTESSEPVVQPEEGVRYLVNVGSVGDPGDGTDRASYCIFDPAANEISLRKVAFDVASFRAELEKVPELATPWFLRRHEGTAVRPADDQAVAAGKVAGSRIRVPSSRAKIRVKASALATHAGETLRVASEPAKAAVQKPRRFGTGLIVGLICLSAAGAMTATYFFAQPPAPASSPGQAAVAPPPAQAGSAAAPAASATPVEARSAPLAVQVIASREERDNGKSNTANLAMDGDPATRWCAGDRLAGNWIQVDLGAELRLTGMKITWEHADRAYGYKIEGSRDTRRWTELAAGSGTSADPVSFAAKVQHVRVYVTQLPDQQSASIAEVRFLDGGGRELETVLAVAAAPAVAAPAPEAAAGEDQAPGEDLLGRVAEARDYKLVYDLDLAKLGSSIRYDQDLSASAPRFDRVAYFIELRKSGQPARYLWVSMDAFTGDASKLGIPTASSGIHFQQSVANLTVVSEVAGVTTGERIGAGNLEFWPNNYGPQNSASVPGASAGIYDFGDGPASPVNGHGSMQVHNTAAKQTLFALNNWRHGSRADLGIGNSSGKTLDWTFSNNAGYYKSKRLRVFVHPAP